MIILIPYLTIYDISLVAGTLGDFYFLSIWQRLGMGKKIPSSRTSEI